MKTKVVGISGVAGSGKDLFFEMLKKDLNCERFALADELKKEIKPFIQSEYGFDITTCDRSFKNLVRPYLVAHGETKRALTQGRYWVDKLTPKIKNRIVEFYLNNDSSNTIIPVVTDIRYNEYDKDEIFWLKNELNGVHVHLRKFTVGKNNNKIFSKPANQSEANQEQKLYESADYCVTWEQMTGSFDDKYKIMKTTIQDFAKRYLT
tara:strand:+ start:1038 stop:1658 length:621 start_codon:yes stop_codon:yes gene_type:complete